MSTTPQYRQLTAEEVGGKIITNPIFTETVTHVNPYKGYTWQEAVIPENFEISKNGAIIIIQGKQHLVSKLYAFSLQTQGCYSPEELDLLFKDDDE